MKIDVKHAENILTDEIDLRMKLGDKLGKCMIDIETLRLELKEAYQGYVDTHDHDYYDADLYKRAMDYLEK